MAVVYEELAGSPRIAITQQGVTAVRTFRVDWNDWREFARILVGTWGVVGVAPRFVSPLAFPGLPHLLVTDVVVEPLDPDTPDVQSVSLGARTNTYSSGGAQVTATYRTLFDPRHAGRRHLPRVPEGTWLVFTAELGAESLSTPGRWWQWRSGGESRKLPADVRPSLLIPTGSFRLDWHRVPLPPWSAMRALRGRVNAEEFLGSPPGTVMLLGARVGRQFQFLEEESLWRVEYLFSERTRPLAGGGVGGWNHFFKQQPEGGEHWLEIEDASGRAPYASGNFQSLFTFE